MSKIQTEKTVGNLSIRTEALAKMTEATFREKFSGKVENINAVWEELKPYAKKTTKKGTNESRAKKGDTPS